MKINLSFCVWIGKIIFSFIEGFPSGLSTLSLFFILYSEDFLGYTYLNIEIF